MVKNINSLHGKSLQLPSLQINTFRVTRSLHEDLNSQCSNKKSNIYSKFINMIMSINSSILTMIYFIKR